ncbi:hypothetical protein K8R33_03405 [archaeon]|nr:hypothetical protein [archaeon]
MTTIYFKKGKQIMEDPVKGTKTTIDSTYRTRDFFKPTFIEYPLYVLGLFASVITGGIGEVLTDNPNIGLACTAIPQAFTYLSFRLAELGAFNTNILPGGDLKELIRESKHQMPYGPRVRVEPLEKTLEKEITDSNSV